MNMNRWLSQRRKREGESDGKRQGLKGKVGLFVFEKKTSEEDGIVELRLSPTFRPAIIAVHGLGGDAHDTWTADNQKIWLRDFLPSQVRNARIMSYGYNSVVEFSKSIGDIDDFAIDLLTRVSDERETPQERARPIIFICHSLGGIVVKNALVYAHSHSSHYGNLLNRVRGVIFMGTPHRGSDIAYWAGLPARALRAAQLGTGTNNSLLSALEQNSETLAGISQQFTQRSANLKIRSFYEIERLDYMNCLIVDKDSAILNLPNEKPTPIQANHRTMCKFLNMDDQKYRPVWKAIKNLVDELMVDADLSQSHRDNVIKITEDYVKYAREDLDRRQRGMEIRGINPTSFDWFPKIPEYIDWSSSRSTALLWHEGKLESERIMLLQTIVMKLMDCSGGQDVVSVFCAKPTTADQAASCDSNISILRSVIGQILGKGHDRIDKLLSSFKTVGRENDVGKLTLEAYFSAPNIKPEDLWSLLRHILITTTQLQTYIVIDGIDSMRAQDRFDFLNQLLELSNDLRSESGCVKRFMITSCPDDNIRKILKGVPVINQDTEWKYCLQSLFFQQMHARRGLVSDAQENTNKWIWDHYSYKEWWLKEESCVLWIQGKPGSGKSTLAKTIQKVLSTKFGESSKTLAEGQKMRNPIVVDFFYSSRGGSTGTSHRLMLQSLLHQILEQEPYLFGLFQEPFRRLRGKSSDDMEWPYSDLEKILLSLVQDGIGTTTNPCRKIHFIMDAMDESEDRDENGRRRANVLSLLSNLCSKRGQNITKIILLSRPANEIERQLRCFHNIKLQEENRADIEKIVDSGLHSIWESMGYGSDVSQPEPAGDAPLKKTRTRREKVMEHSAYKVEHALMKSYLLEHAKGVILWVVLIIRELAGYIRKGYHTMGDIKKKLASLPTDLERAYEDIIDRLRDTLCIEDCGKARIMVAWAGFAKRPLTVEEFRDAIAISNCSKFKPSRSFLHDNRIRVDSDWEPMRRAVVDMSGCLLEVVRPNMERFEAFATPTVNATDIVQFLHRTAKDFLVHSKRAGQLQLDQGSCERLITTASLKYLMGSLPIEDLQDKEIQQWNRRDYIKFINSLLDMPLLSYVLSFLTRHIADPGLDEMHTLSEFLQQLRSQPDGHAWSFLKMWSYQEGLVPSDLTHEITSAEYFMIECLMTASEAGHAGAVRLILDAKADIEGKDPTGRKALHAAAERGREAVVIQLLERGAELESRDSLGRTPLLRAAQEGHGAVVKQLLKKGADLESKDNARQTPLWHAAINGHEAAVKQLIKKGAELELKDGYSRTPLLLAAWNGHEAVVRQLVEKGAALESKDDFGQTPLSWAAVDGHREVVKHLLAGGARLESRDKYGRTPLSWAARKGQGAVVELLLERGAELEPQDNNDKTPLSWASQNGHEAVVEQLLAKGAEREPRDSKGWTPLAWASQNGHAAVVKQLLAKGAERESRDNQGRTPLAWASQNGHAAVVKRLLAKGADRESRDNKGQTPLWWAKENKHVAVVNLLTSSSRSVFKPFRSRKTA